MNKRTVELDNIKAVDMIRMACLNTHNVIPRITAKVVGGQWKYTVTISGDK